MEAQKVNTRQGKRDAEAYAVLRTFSSREISRFSAFMNSEFCNPDQSLRLYCNALLEFSPSFRLSEVQELALLPPDEDPARTAVYHYNNQLISRIEDFLVWESRNKGLISRELVLAREYRDRKLRVRYHRTIRKAERTLSRHQLDDFEVDTARYQLSRFVLTDHDEFATNTKALARLGHHMEEAMKSLDRLFLADKLRVGAELLNRNRTLKEEHKIRLLPQVLSNLPEHKDPASIRVYGALVELLQHMDSEEHYYRYKGELLSTGEHFHPEEYRSLFNYGLNAVTYHGMRGKPGFREEYLALIEYMIEADIFTLEPITASQFKNIVLLYVGTAQVDRADTFLENYKDLLVIDPSNKDVIGISRATIAFAYGEFDRTLEELNAMDWINPSHVVNLRILRMRVYFEQDEFNLLSSELDAFSTYLSYHESLKDVREIMITRARQFVSVARAIVNLPPDSDTIMGFREKVSGMNNLVAKDWFLDFLLKKAGQQVR